MSGIVRIEKNTPLETLSALQPTDVVIIESDVSVLQVAALPAIKEAWILNARYEIVEAIPKNIKYNLLNSEHAEFIRLMMATMIQQYRRIQELSLENTQLKKSNDARSSSPGELVNLLQKYLEIKQASTVSATPHQPSKSSETPSISGSPMTRPRSSTHPSPIGTPIPAPTPPLKSSSLRTSSTAFFDDDEPIAGAPKPALKKIKGYAGLFSSSPSTSTGLQTPPPPSPFSLDGRKSSI